MKQLLFIILTIIFLKINIFGQEIEIEEKIYWRKMYEFSQMPEEILNSLDKSGIDSSEILNIYESKYLNYIFDISVKDFDFFEKKIVFVYKCGYKENKKFYFDVERKRRDDNISGRRDDNVSGRGLYCDLFIFNEKEKEDSGNYDAAISFVCKMPVKNGAVDIIKWFKIEEAKKQKRLQKQQKKCKKTNN
jgi:hypothetical protein